MCRSIPRCNRLIVMAFAMLFAIPIAHARQIIGQLTDPEQPAEAAYVDILSARIEQDGGLLTFIIETRGSIPTTLAQPEDHLTFIWLVDADNNPNTGQPHGGTGTEFNVRAVISEVYGGGFVDVTGSMPGGGIGTVSVLDNRVQVTIGMGQINSPTYFHWQADACHAIDNVCVTANYHTAVTDASTLPYTPPARVTITTPLLMLCPAGPATGQVQVELRDGDANVLNNADYHLLYQSTNEAVATVDASGLVTAHAVPAAFNDTPVIQVSADGVAAGSAAIIRVTNSDLGVIHRAYSGSNVAFYLPELIEGVDLDSITTGYQVVLATDLAYAAQHALTGVTPFGGGVHWFVLDVGNDPPTLPCGLSGNPVRLGWEFGKAVHNSCYIVNWPDDRVPQWGVIFHEMGHNFTWPSWGFGQFCSTGSPHDWKYSEALASMAGAWSWWSLQQCPSALSASVREGIGRDYPNIIPEQRAALTAYVAAGAHYDQVTVEVICDIFWELYDDYGAIAWYDFFSTFVPVDQPLPVTLDSEARQATWVTAAASVTAGEDLRGRFAGEYGFPIDDAAWPEILTAVQTRIAARPWPGPAVADFDCDGDVDLGDFSKFQDCFNGPNRSPKSGACVRPDLDSDVDVDLADFGAFQNCFNGPNRPPKCS